MDVILNVFNFVLLFNTTFKKMYTNDINVLAPNTTKPTFNTKALVEELINHGFGLQAANGIWVYTNKQRNGAVYGPHFVNLTNGYRTVRIKNSYDGTCPFEVDFGGGAKRYPKTTAITEVLSDIADYQPTFDDTFLPMDEQMALVVECGRTRWSNFTEDMAAEVTATQYTIDRLKDEALTMVLNGYKFEGQKRAKAITDPIVKWRYYQAITAIFANLPSTPEISEDVTIPPKPNKYIYIGKGRTKRPNPEYAKWMELYSDLVEA